MSPNHSDLSEEWVAYRKLVIDTLSKLDDRSLELYDRVAELASRVSNLEKAGYPAEREIRNLDKQHAMLCEDHKESQKRIETLERDMASKNAMAATFKWMLGALWAVLTVVAGLAISYITGK